ncbi:hypothetical protein BLNAU_13134 [Blattamonas nauphoetae]|uniref:Uncharacterized protein n=1 Tax=Blattamonas nauphoetae TaxID=2049346 RepID=A0ABQ9XHH3_9EUKA|nr:hypothetical protein BLNAU_13134 [Blattamonas nauphoetae]
MLRVKEPTKRGTGVNYLSLLESACPDFDLTLDRIYCLTTDGEAAVKGHINDLDFASFRQHYLESTLKIENFLTPPFLLESAQHFIVTFCGNRQKLGIDELAELEQDIELFRTKWLIYLRECVINPVRVTNPEIGVEINYFGQT